MSDSDVKEKSPAYVIFRIRKKTLLWIVSIFILFLTSSVFCFFNMGRWLVIDQKPEKADLILTLSGGIMLRMDKAIQLQQEGYAPVILITGPKSNEGWSSVDLMKQQARQAEVPDNAIAVKEGAFSTVDEIRKAAEYIKEHNLQKVLLVTSAYHTRRCMIYCKELMPDHVNVICVPAYEEFIRLDYTWWSEASSCREVFTENFKILWHYIFREEM